MQGLKLNEKRQMKLRRFSIVGSVILFGFVLIYLSAPAILKTLGNFIVRSETPVVSDAVVVLNTGVEYYPRLIEAAAIFNKGIAHSVVINGNRKTDTLRQLEQRGFETCCPWDENSLRILSLYGVPRGRVIRISVEDAYDTISEAETVGAELIRRGLNRVIIATSKYHSRRAGFIWEKLLGKQLSIRTVTAATDPYDPDGWWKEGRQIRWVLAEYGAWIFYVWKNLTKNFV